MFLQRNFIDYVGGSKDFLRRSEWRRFLHPITSTSTLTEFICPENGGRSFLSETS